MSARPTDRLGRSVRDLRISLTDRCNLRCTYCMPREVFGPDYAFLKKHEWLRFEELHRIVAAMSELGVRKVRLTGGEPLLRPGLAKFIDSLRQFPAIEDIALTTNGLRLAERARELREAGLHRVTVSLDALDPDICGRMNGLGIAPKAAIAGIEEAVRCGFSVKLNTVVERGVNESEILPLARFAKNLGISLRFIEFMDVGNHNRWKMERVVSGKEILDCLLREFALDPVDLTSAQAVAKTYRHRGTAIEVGVITSVTQPFCGNCTRLRLSADGKLYTCLFASHGFDLRAFLRDERPAPQALASRLRELWRSRDDRYSEIRSEKNPAAHKVEMSYIGG